METMAYLALAALVLVGIFVYLWHSREEAPPPESIVPYVPPAKEDAPVAVEQPQWQPEKPTPYRGTYSLNKPKRETEYLWDDDEFERVVLNSLESNGIEVLNSFYTKIAGGKHKNDDGTSRATLIRKCEEANRLEIVWEPDNAFDPNALAVYSGEGQLGFIQAHIAAEQVREIKRNGVRLTAFFRHANRHPETNRVVGAVIYLVQCAPKLKETE